MIMTAKRQGEIALLLIKAMSKRNGVDDLLERLLELDKVSAHTGIPVSELEIFGDIVVSEIVAERLRRK
jgi:hypothetical protein